MSDDRQGLVMLVRRDAGTGRWAPVWPRPLTAVLSAETPRPNAMTCVTLPRTPGAQVGDRFIAEEEASELVRRCGPLELPSLVFIERVYRRFGCDESNRDLLDARIAATEVWLVRPVPPGEGRSPAADE